MKNTMNTKLNGMNEQQVAAAIYADLKASNVNVGSKDKMYEAVRRYVSITREQFEDSYKQMEESRELNESELDMVTGGTFMDFLRSDWGQVALIAAAVLVCAGLGAAGYAAVVALSSTAATTAAAAAVGATAMSVGEAALTGGVLGGILGFSVGVCCATEVLRS